MEVAPLSAGCVVVETGGEYEAIARISCLTLSPTASRISSSCKEAVPPPLAAPGDAMVTGAAAVPVDLAEVEEARGRPLLAVLVGAAAALALAAFLRWLLLGMASSACC